MKHLIFLISLFWATVLSAQNYSGLQLETSPHADHYTLVFFVDDTLYERAEYYCEQEVNRENVVQLMKEGALVLNGQYVQYYPKGTMQLLCRFIMGTVSGQVVEYYPDGHLKMIANWEDGRLQGRLQSFYPNGAPMIESNFENDQKMGRELIYYPDSVLWAVLKYNLGRLDGRQLFYDKEGRLKRKYRYDNGSSLTKIKKEDKGETQYAEIYHYPASVDTLSKQLEKLRLPDFEKKDTVVNIPIVLAVDQEGKVSSVHKYGTNSVPNKDRIRDWAATVSGLDRATFDGIPVDYLLTLPLSFYNGEWLNRSYRSSRQDVLKITGDEHWLLSSVLNFERIVEPAAVIEKLKAGSKDGEVFVIVEKMPEYPGGEKALRNFIRNEIIYPVSAARAGVQGRVYVSFVVQPDGSIDEVRVVRSVHPLLDAEAVRVVKKMTGWKPGRQKGKPVKVKFTVPISFSLQSSKDAKGSFKPFSF
ncbi:TonB family protein [Roseimarinus sediminis]|jgi:TonB family protein|uniref:TonB family protein n=1 Tax=Roseimarinus sediminis TaxID=1610899 RepID=UPI003D260026